MKKIALVLMAGLLSVSAFAQSTKAVVRPAGSPAAQTESKAGVPAVASVAALSPLEKSELENIALKAALLKTQAQQQYNDLQAQRASLINEIVKAHPGYVWHESQNQTDPEGLVPLAKPAVEEKK